MTFHNIETKRLVLREFDKGDFLSVHSYASDPEISKYQLLNKSIRSEKMSDILIFRGRAATGKTYITDILSNKLNIAVIRKDDIYNSLSKYGLEQYTINMMSYDILAKIIQTNIDISCNLIIDIGLYHNLYFKQFLSNINFKNSNLYPFLCICSDGQEWNKRIEKRLTNPLPNQTFKTVEEANKYYDNLNTEALENEIILDSVDDISSIIEKIDNVLKIDL